MGFKQFAKKARGAIRSLMGGQAPDNGNTPAVRDNNYHFRIMEDGVIQSRGGVTVTYRVEANREGFFSCVFGCAVCSPTDNYSKKIGRLRSMGNIEIKQYERPPTCDEVRSTALTIAKASASRVFSRQMSLSGFLTMSSTIFLITRNRPPVRLFT